MSSESPRQLIELDQIEEWLDPTGDIVPDAAFVSCLAVQLRADGQLSPISVRRNGNRRGKTRWKVIDGRARFRAAQALGWTEIGAVEDADQNAGDDEMRRIRTAYNHDRRTVRPIERAIFIAARYATFEERAHPDHVGETPQQRGARLRWAAGAAISPASEAATPEENWRAQAAAALGCSDRTMKAYLAIYRGIVQALPDLYASFNNHALGARLHIATKIAGLPEIATRRTVIEAVLAEPELTAIEPVLVRLGISTNKHFVEVSDDEAQAIALRHFHGLTVAQRKGFVSSFARGVSKPEMDEALAVWRAKGWLA